jgi:hypothetical protein
MSPRALPRPWALARGGRSHRGKPCTLEEFLTGDEDAAKVMKDMNDQVNNVLEFASK